MQNAGVKNFMDRYLMIHCFSRWKARNLTLRMLDELEERVELCWMKDAMVKWYIHVHGPKKERMARKIEKYKGFVRSFRMSVEDGVLSSLESLRKGAVVAGGTILRGSRPPPPTEEEIAAAREACEASRKKRIANALKYNRRKRGKDVRDPAVGSNDIKTGGRQVRRWTQRTGNL